VRGTDGGASDWNGSDPGALVEGAELAASELDGCGGGWAGVPVTSAADDCAVSSSSSSSSSELP
jgi:hypothetical protein